MIQMIELVDKHVQIAITDVFQMFKKAEEHICIKELLEHMKKKIERTSRNKKYNVWDEKYTGWN